MRRSPVLALAVLAAGAAPQAGRTPPPPTLAELQALPDDCPLIYDNDWLRDVVDDDYVFLQAHLGRANLKGVVLTKDLWENGNFYSLELARADFDGEIAILRRMGLRNIPDYKVGATRLLQRPASGRIEDTPPERSEGIDLIVQEARKATPQKPLVVFVGGPLNSVANAYLVDPSIADRMVVMMTDLTGYNGKDPWANTIVATRCRLVNFGASRIWWPRDPPVLDPARFDALPPNEHVAEMKRVVTTFDHSLGDGAGPMLFFRPESWRAVVRCRVDGVFSFQDVASDPYDFLDAAEVDFDGMGNEFFGVVEAVYGGGVLREPDNPPGTVPGLDWAYYEGSWAALPDFGTLAPARTGTVGGFDLSPRLRDDLFGFRFTGYVEVPADGTYTFSTTSDDGSRLYLGSRLVVDNDGLHGMQERSGTVTLSAGPHAIRVEFFEREGEEELVVSWQGPGVGKQEIPSSVLSAPPAPPAPLPPALEAGGGEGEEGCGLVGLEAAVLAALVLRLGARRRR